MTSTFDAVIVGAGLAGLQMLHQVRQIGLTARVFEAGGDAGGTWYWNRYPGARCDVESLEYSYQFSAELQQEWEWTRRYATQPEILRYVEHVVKRFDLRRDIQFGTRVTALTYDEPAGRWEVRTESGVEAVARFVIMATGCLSAANMPQIPGRWPDEPVELAGKRVGVIGTGSSGVQVIPIIAQQAERLYVFQRTAAYTLPAGDEPLDPDLQAAIKADYAGFRERNNAVPTAGLSRFPTNPNSIFLFSAAERQALFEHCWARGGPLLLRAFGDVLVNLAANELVAEFVREKIRHIVKNPDIAALLSPKHVIGCKRICLGSGYYETFNRPNVQLVDIASAPIERITPDGIRTTVDAYGTDVLVFATGYDAMTGALLRIDIRGRDGRSLRDAWADGPGTYLGLGVPGFPNLFTMTGPGSPSVLTNVLVAIHQHATWIGDCLKYLVDNDISAIEATSAAEEAWGRHVSEVADQTLLPTCGSWYLGANIPGKRRVFMPLVGFPAYAQKCAEVAASDYPGFALTCHGPSPDRPNRADRSAL
jgi:cation diffusion facilitator CzcD-associated flavoprotein CzcO